MRNRDNQENQQEIVVVDDSLDSLQFLTNILESHGYSVRPASNGVLALETVAARLPDLILLDVKMPGLDGYEVCRRLKSNEHSRKVPVIFISALGETIDKVGGFKAGGVDYIVKPFEREEVLARVGVHLRLRELTEHLEQEVDQRTAELTLANQRLRQQIFERERVEEKLRESEKRYSEIVEGTDNLITEVDAEGRFTFVNETARKVFGLSPQECIGRMAFDFIHPDDREGTHENFLRWIEDKKPSVTFENRQMSRSGQVTDMHWTINLHFDDRENITSIKSIARDVTEQKKAQEALSWEAEVNLAAAELSRKLLSPASINDISYLILEHAKRLTSSAYGYVGYIDPETGYFVVPTHTRDIWDVCQVADKDIVFEKFTGLWGWVLKNQKPLLTNAPVDDPRSLGTPPGHVPIDRFLSVPALIGETLAGQVSVANADHDYTDRELKVIERLANLYAIAIQRQQAEEEIRRHRDQLEELVAERTAELTIAKDAAEEARRLAEAASHAKSVFLAQMSHELRTPLNAILGYAQILKRRPLAPDVIDALNTVQRSGEHLLTLINDILDIAKIEAGRLELYPSEINFPNFLEHIASIIRARAQAKGLIFSFKELSALPAGVKADETRLRQVLLNLLDNAVKFTDQGEVVLSVGVCEYESEAPPHPHTSTLRFSVRDTGIGIPPDQLERIFQPFEQVGHATRWTSGTGLGLAISRQLVHLMGGDLQVESPLSVSPTLRLCSGQARGESPPPTSSPLGGIEGGPGSTFWFEIVLPVTEMAVEAVQPPERTITGYRGPRRTVLVVDDVPSSRAILVDLLQPLGFEIIEAVDGQQALHLAQALWPDLILMDRWMPGLDGFEAARRMWQIPELRETLIVTVSASVSQEDQAQSQEVGIDAFLPKPVSWPRLATLLEENLALEWEYEEQRSGGVEEQEREFPSASLTPPPQEELTVLYDLAMRGNMRAIRERAAHVETLDDQYVPFARRLHELAESFEERQILALVIQYMGDKEKGED